MIRINVVSEAAVDGWEDLQLTFRFMQNYFQHCKTFHEH